MMIDYNSHEYREQVMNMIADTSAEQASLDMLQNARIDSIRLRVWSKQEQREAELLAGFLPIGGRPMVVTR